jgi:hypothetical protein
MMNKDYYITSNKIIIIFCILLHKLKHFIIQKLKKTCFTNTVVDFHIYKSAHQNLKNDTKIVHIWFRESNLTYFRQEQITRPEIMRPLRETMDFVDADKSQTRHVSNLAS